MEGFWTWHIARSHDKSSCGEREFVDCVVKAEDICDHRRRELSFEVGDCIYLKVFPMRCLRRYKVRVKLARRFIGPFKILEKRGEIAH
jgi:hypothetical protein